MVDTVVNVAQRAAMGRNGGVPALTTWIVGAIAIATVACVGAGIALGNGSMVAGGLFWSAIAMAIYALRPGSFLNSVPMGELTTPLKAVIVVALAIEIALCTLPMGLAPFWNGDVPAHRNQYELLAESFLDGKLYIDYDDVDERLAEMDNPYDPQARERQHVEIHRDHAYYDGKYYVYFGVVPVLLVFLPYRLLTGSSLATFHVTQLFAALAICGVFALFYALARSRFRRMPFGVYLALAASFSLVAVWYGAATPALYCTATMAGLAFMVWSLFFYVRAFLAEESFARQLACAFAGALCGALVFGCRPPIAIANLVAVPLFVQFLRSRSLNGRQKALLASAISPYIIVAAGLMAYNYARFGSCFEFGQAYQLTIADQHLYGFSLDRVDLANGIPALLGALFAWNAPSSDFPFVSLGGTFANFPILLIAFGVFVPGVFRCLRNRGLAGMCCVALAVVVITVAVDLFFSPFYIQRYNMDIYYLLGIAAFLVIGAWYEGSGSIGQPNRAKRTACYLLCILAVASCLACAAFFLTPFDHNAAADVPAVVEAARNVVLFWEP